MLTTLQTPSTQSLVSTHPSPINTRFFGEMAGNIQEEPGAPCGAKTKHKTKNNNNHQNPNPALIRICQRGPWPKSELEQ